VKPVAKAVELLFLFEKMGSRQKAVAAFFAICDNNTMLN
jgi:hypothetical protein